MKEAYKIYYFDLSHQLIKAIPMQCNLTSKQQTQIMPLRPAKQKTNFQGFCQSSKKRNKNTLDKK